MSDTNRPNPTPSSNPSDGEGLAQRLIEQVSALQQRIDKAERRVRVERALADAQAADVQAAADEIELDAGVETDLAAAVRRLKRSKPGLFRQHGEIGGSVAAVIPNQPARPDQHLTILREQARKGDRASLLLYLRARRDKA